MKFLKSLIESFFVNCRYFIYKFYDFIFILKYWFKHPVLFKIDSRLFLKFFLFSAYRYHNKFFHVQLKEKNHPPYGETLISSWIYILKRLNIDSTSSIVDLGSGRGRILFWSSVVLGINSFGLEIISTFSKFSSYLKEIYNIKNLHFVNCDLFNTNIPITEYIYCYCTAWDDETMMDIAIWLSSLKNKPKIITVSNKLSSYVDSFDIIDSFDVEFGWGKACVYVQEIKVKSVQ